MLEGEWPAFAVVARLISCFGQRPGLSRSTLARRRSHPSESLLALITYLSFLVIIHNGVHTLTDEIASQSLQSILMYRRDTAAAASHILIMTAHCRRSEMKQRPKIIEEVACWIIFHMCNRTHTIHCKRRGMPRHPPQSDSFVRHPR